ncbi:Uncharacterised protein [Mycobacterium tuberculosis]|uniref:Uncharacterized protein n=1 Tax=Mycobacterium tuberculosis TaxID=1773 RepID=A0A655F3P2_MYCTX|nr:Uncharacterised protein [Mycobacterium tuberculosis]CKS00110.1 Uncharacterised protein [Mycobacterium tuberculosis]CKT14366.1 Uncharacterised protein [Mycobacterium tuberculosis]CNV46870.1 Uncharacterised protein [Mycobacterium tuberculosis]CNW84175.1 Uncharacterised protein [Mycobacterium tuberculosis]
MQPAATTIQTALTGSLRKNATTVQARAPITATATKKILCRSVMGERPRMATGGRSASARTQLACPERSSIRFDGVGAATVTSLNHGCDLR